MATDRQKLAVAADDFTRLSILAATATRMLEHGLVDDVRAGLADLERLAGEYAAGMEFHLTFVRPSIHDVDGEVPQAPGETDDGEDLPTFDWREDGGSEVLATDSAHAGASAAAEGVESPAVDNPVPGPTTDEISGEAAGRPFTATVGNGHPSTPYPRFSAPVVPILRGRAPAATATAVAVEPDPVDEEPPPGAKRRQLCPLCDKPVAVLKGGGLRRHPCAGVQPARPSPGRSPEGLGSTRRNEPGGEQTLTREQVLAIRGYTPEELHRPDPWR